MFQHPALPAPPALRPSFDGAGAPAGFFSISLGDAWQIAWRRKAWIAVPTVLALAGALAFALAVPARYTANAQLLIEPNDLRLVEGAVTQNSSYADTSIAEIESQAHVLRSRGVLRRVVESENLVSDPEFFDEAPGNPLRAVMADLVGQAGIARGQGRPADPEMQAVRALEERLSVARTERSFVVNVAVTTEDADKSARIVDALVRTFLQTQADARSDVAQRASDSLSARLDELAARVEESERRVVEYKARNDIVLTSGQLVDEQQLREINDQLVQARSQTAQSRARFEQIERLRAGRLDLGAVSEAIQSPTVADLRAQYSQAVRQAASLSSRYGPRHPALADAEAQLRDVRALIEEELERISVSAGNELERDRAREASLAQSLETLKRQSAVTDEALVRLRELEREAQASRAVYEAFLVRAQETGAQSQLDTLNARVISEATPPVRKSWPPRMLVLLAGALLLGVGAGSGMALLRELSDGRVWIARRVEAATGLPVLAAPRGRRRRGLSLFTARPAPPDPDMVRLRNRLRTARPADRAARILLVGADSARATRALALGLSRAAKAGEERVLLVEGGTAPGKAKKTAAPVPGLAVARIEPGAPIETAARKILAEARGFDLVVIDGGCEPGPAMYGYAEASDQIVIAARMGRTRLADIREAMAALHAHAGKLRGLVLARPGRYS